MNGLSTRVMLTVALVVAAVGATDALVGAQWDLFVVFCLTLSIQLLLWLRYRAHRTPVTVRADLARWVEQQSARTGEPFDDVLDRTVAWYRAGLYGDGTQRRTAEER